MSTRVENVIARQKVPARWQADSVLALVAFVWGSTFVVVKHALADITTMYFLALRFTFASGCMLVAFGPRFRSVSGRALWRGLRGGVAAGVFLWLGFALQTVGLRYTTAGKSGFITGLYIVLVPLISAAVYGRWPRPAELAGVAIAGTGTMVLVAPALYASMSVNRGDLLTMACAVAFAFHLLVLGYFSQRERFEAVALGQILCCAALSAGAVGFEGARAVWSAGVVFAIILTALLATALAFALQTWAQQYTTATRTAVIFALEPVFALATAVIAGGERLTLYAAVGGAMILAGILVVEMRPEGALNGASESARR
ncbi:MAG: DMT family transporter [Acidobacteriaceae bacterium]|nr:DMT family transporter [Acidobacteriaceae bacterium]